jgi:hypothetical protein
MPDLIRIAEIEWRVPNAISESPLEFLSILDQLKEGGGDRCVILLDEG